MEYCCHICANTPSCYLELLDILQKWICRTAGPSLAASSGWGSWKTNNGNYLKRGLGQFADLKGGLAKKKGVVFWEGLISQCTPCTEVVMAVFSIWKSPWVLQKACTKIVPVLFTYTLLCWKIKSCFDSCFLQWIRPPTTAQWYILRDYSSVKIGVNLINKRHTQPIACIMIVKIC